MRINKIVYIIFLFCSVLLKLNASIIEVIDIPTAEVVDYGIGDITIKLYGDGGVITRVVFAPFNRLNFGGSLDIEKMISKENPVLRDPQFYFKWRVFDGSKYFPALAVGYDGQGYEFNSISNEYVQPSKGLFLAFTLNLMVETLFVDFGVNVTKFKEEKNKPFLFFGGRFTIEQIIRIILEYQNINDTETHQLNAGVSFLLSDYLNLDLIFKNLYSKNNIVDRQIKICYFYKFF